MITPSIAVLSRSLRERSRSSTELVRNRHFGEFHVGTRTYDRLCLTIRAAGCSVPSCTMCPLPDFGAGVSPSNDLLDAVATEIDKAPRKPEMLSLYNDGSYYAPTELAPEVRHGLEDLVRQHDVSLFNVETLPSFFDAHAIDKTRERTRAELLINVGVQSFDAEIRGRCIGSPFTKRHLERTLETAQQASLLLRIYLLFKAPFLNEGEAMQDLQRSLKAGMSSGAAIVSVNPCKVASGTVLEQAYRQGLYRAPHLHSVATVLRQLNRLREGTQITVEMPGHGGCPGDVALPHTCDRCAFLEGFLATGDAPPDGDPDCWAEHLALEPAGSWKQRADVFTRRLASISGLGTDG